MRVIFPPYESMARIYPRLQRQKAYAVVVLAYKALPPGLVTRRKKGFTVLKQNIEININDRSGWAGGFFKALRASYIGELLGLRLTHLIIRQLVAAGA